MAIALELYDLLAELDDLLILVSDFLCELIFPPFVFLLFLLVGFESLRLIFSFSGQSFLVLEQVHLGLVDLVLQVVQVDFQPFLLRFEGSDSIFHLLDVVFSGERLERRFSQFEELGIEELDFLAQFSLFFAHENDLFIFEIQLFRQLIDLIIQILVLLIALIVAINFVKAVHQLQTFQLMVLPHISHRDPILFLQIAHFFSVLSLLRIRLIYSLLVDLALR